MLSLGESESTATIVRFEWTLSSQPAGADAALDTSGAGTAVIQPDAPGTYELCAQVFNDLGIGSMNDCCIAIDADNGLDMIAQLTTDTASEALSLHVTQRDDEGALCVDGAAGLVSTSCDNGLACEPTSCAPDWGGASPSFTDTGFGSETISVEDLVDGDYLVSVRSSAFDDGGATLRLFLRGPLAGEFFVGSAIEANSVVDVAMVRVSDGQACVEDITDGIVDDECP